jgi:hypothetical protein
MTIDDPLKAAKAQIASDERQSSRIGSGLAKVVGALGAPLAGDIAAVLERRKAENRDYFTEILTNELEQLRSRVEEIKEEHRRFLKTDYVELIVDGLGKAENVRSRERIRRLAKILVTAAEIGPSTSPDQIEEFLQIATVTTELDIAVLREIYSVQFKSLSESQVGRIGKDIVNDLWKSSPPIIDGVLDGDIQSCCATLQGFGLVERIDRNDFKLGPDKTPYALLKRGAEFVHFIREFE